MDVVYVNYGKMDVRSQPFEKFPCARQLQDQLVQLIGFSSSFGKKSLQTSHVRSKFYEHVYRIHVFMQACMHACVHAFVHACMHECISIGNALLV